MSMSDRLHDYDYILAACAAGCAACAQTEADLAVSRQWIRRALARSQSPTRCADSIAVLAPSVFDHSP